MADARSAASLAGGAWWPVAAVGWAGLPAPGGSAARGLAPGRRAARPLRRGSARAGRARSPGHLDRLGRRRGGVPRALPRSTRGTRGRCCSPGGAAPSPCTGRSATAVRYAAYDEADGHRGRSSRPTERIPMAEDTVFDLASRVEAVHLDPGRAADRAGRAGAGGDGAPRTCRSSRAAGKQDITVRQLLTHTSGLRAWIAASTRSPTREGKLRLLWSSAAAGDPPGTVYLYSDLNLISLQLLLEEITGRTLDVLLRRRDHRSTRDAPHSFQPAALLEAEDRRHRGRPPALVRPGPRAGVGRGARRERVRASAGSRATPVSSPAPGTWPSSPAPCSTAGSTAGSAHPAPRVRGADVHRLQHRLPRRRARPRLRALPALVHGRDGHPALRRPHRLHRDLPRPRPDHRLLPRPARQLRPPGAQLAVRQRARGSPRRTTSPAPSRSAPRHGRTSWFSGMASRDDRRTLTLPPLHHRRLTGARPAALRAVVGHRSGPDALYLEASTDGGDDLAAGAVHDRTGRGRRPAGASAGSVDGLVGPRLAPAVVADLPAGRRARPAALAVHDRPAVRRPRGVRGRRCGSRTRRPPSSTRPARRTPRGSRPWAGRLPPTRPCERRPC